MTSSSLPKNNPTSGWPPNPPPHYRPTLLVSIAASAAVVIGSLASWAHVMWFNVGGLDFGNWGVATLILGAASCVALVTLLFWSFTPFAPRWAVTLAWGIVVAAVACLVDAVINIVRLLTGPKGDIFGVSIGPSVGWGLWLVAFSATAMGATALIVATAVSKSVQMLEPSEQSSTSWSNGWRAAALGLSAVVVIAGIVYGATHRFKSDEDLNTSLDKPSFPNPFSETSSAKPSETVSAGQEVRVGDLSFTVTRVVRRSSVGDSNDIFGRQNAKGIYEIVYYTVKNEGNEPASIDSTYQKLFIDNRKYSSDMLASENADQQARNSASMNPGLSDDLVVAFDVPRGTPLGELEVHGTYSDSGARIDLSNASG